MNLPAPRSEQTCAPSRRALLATAAWSVPAVSVAVSSPAYASSTPAPSCVSALTHVTNWDTSDPTFKAKVDTGWYDRNNFMPDNNGAPHDNVTVANRAWYMGLYAPGEELPTGSFLSFANNPSATGVDQKITIRWTFTIAGRATIDVNGMLMFGYGNHTGGRTGRQLVDIFVDGLADGRTAPVAQVAAARSDGNGVFYPTDAMTRGNASNAGVYAQLESDADLRARGYDVVPPANVKANGRFDANYRVANILDDVTAPRNLIVRMELTLPALPNAATWVNDDVIVYPPTVIADC